MCVGIDYCTKKNCLENERCVLYEPKHISPCEVRRGPKKKKNKKTKVTSAECLGRPLCDKENICNILGQCVLDHCLIKDKPDLRLRIAGSKSISLVLKIFNKLNPPVTLRGQVKNYSRRK